MKMQVTMRYPNKDGECLTGYVQGVSGRDDPVRQGCFCVYWPAIRSEGCGWTLGDLVVQDPQLQATLERFAAEPPATFLDL